MDDEPRISVTGVSGVELTTGMRVLVHLDDNGVFHGIVDRFERDGAVAVIMPTLPSVRDVFPNGYNLGSAHWKDHLTISEEDKR